VIDFVSKYATAAHLALLTVAPLFLFPLCGEGEIAKVLLWLSLLCSAWIVMSPSKQKGEFLHDAKCRFAGEVVRDPLFWLSLAFVVYAGIRALNGGVGFKYDAEFSKWALHRPDVDMLPGCVDGAGFLPFACCVALLVLLQGLRHALDRKTARSFYLSLTVLAGISAIVAVFMLSSDGETAIAMQSCEYANPSFIGTAYGICLVCGVATAFACIEEKVGIAVTLIALISNGAIATGLVLFAPQFTVCVFLVAILILSIVSFIAIGRKMSGGRSLRYILVVLVVVAAVVLPLISCDDGSALATRRDQVLSLQFFPKGFSELRNVLSGVSLRVWKGGPWLGSGLGSFSLDMRAVATPADWAVATPFQAASINGWWQLLVERGVVGALFMACALGMLIWTYVRKVVFQSVRRSLRGIHFTGCLVLMVLVVLAFVDCSFLRADVLLSASAAFALATTAIPVRNNVNSDIEEVR
jgi:hypothetical protein